MNKYYDVKIVVNTMDEETEKTKKRTERLIVYTSGMTEIEAIVAKYYEGVYSDYTIKSQTETNIQTILQ